MPADKDFKIRIDAFLAEPDVAASFDAIAKLFTPSTDFVRADKLMEASTRHC